jgi:TPP-dependent pyruvate/acetoin dehydrogenase alpha subunit
MTWYNRDPLVKNRILINKYKEQIRKEIAKAVKYAENSPFPPRKELLKDVY